MKKHIKPILTTGIVILTASAAPAALVGLWEFDDSDDLGKATVGSDVAWTGSPTASAGVSGGDGAAFSPKSSRPWRSGIDSSPQKITIIS